MISIETWFWTHSYSLNSTGVCNFHLLNVYLTGRSGVTTDKVMEMVTVEPDIRDRDWDVMNSCVSPKGFAL